VTSRLRITVEGTTWTNQRGYGRFLREILTAALRLGTPHAFTLVADTSLPDATVIPGVSIVRVPLKVASGVAASADSRRSIADMRAMSRALAAVPADCVFFPTVYSFVPVLTRVPVIVGIHDVIPEQVPGYVFPNPAARRFWSAKVWAAAKQATRVMTVSRHAAAGITRRLKIPDSRIRIVGEAPAAAFHADAPTGAGRDVLRTAGVPEDARFFLYVGGIAPHKNLGPMIDALRTLPPDVRILFVGDYSRDAFLSSYQELEDKSRRTGEGRVIFTGRLDDEAVAALMRLAQALVLPSFDEGFGLPGIEAAACGAAVIATRNSAMPEVLGDAAIAVDPFDDTAIIGAMAQVLADAPLRASLGRRALERARDWTWDAAARRLISMFEELAP
jgi:glycosyltransferase involved in cell wall biosynthesis